MKSFPKVCTTTMALLELLLQSGCKCSPCSGLKGHNTALRRGLGSSEVGQNLCATSKSQKET